MYLNKKKEYSSDADVIVIGGGASGMMCAINTARTGHRVILIEKNEKLGKKLFITGKGRCNYTNDCDREKLMESVLSNPKFMYGAFYLWDSEKTISFFEDLGLKGKTERGGRVFPVSDKSSDVIKALEKGLRIENVNVMLKTKVKRLLFEETYTAEESQKKETKICTGVLLENGKELHARHVVVATGGMSYPSTGSDGDGYEFAKSAGHSVTKIRAGLAPLVIKEKEASDMQGLSLKNIEIKITDKNKKILYKDFGELIFTHFGVSGPVILTAESMIENNLEHENLFLSIDMKPALDEKKLDMRLIREIEYAKTKLFKNVLKNLLPAKAVPVFYKLSKISEDKRACDITSEERKRIVLLLKSITFTVTGTRGVEEAIITRGGVNVNEINPKSMESKLVKGLYFVGEVLDVDAVTGGFNLQIAWASAYRCASSQF